SSLLARRDGGAHHGRRARDGAARPRDERDAPQPRDARQPRRPRRDGDGYADHRADDGAGRVRERDSPHVGTRRRRARRRALRGNRHRAPARRGTARLRRRGVSAARVSPTSTFAALKVRNYRLYWLGLICYVLGHRAEYVTFAWVVWEVTREPIYLGYLGLAQGVPLIVFQLFGG